MEFSQFKMHSQMQMSNWECAKFKSNNFERDGKTQRSVHANVKKDVVAWIRENVMENKICSTAAYLLL